VADTAALLDEARALGLFRPQAPFEVHCANCHARLDGRGDCSTCGLIGRSDGELAKRAQVDPAGTTKLLQSAIAKRKAYRPAGREKSAER
jgi:hypothetical protein